MEQDYALDATCLLPAFSYVLHLFVFTRIYFYRSKAEGVKAAASSSLLGAAAMERSRNVSDLVTRSVPRCRLVPVVARVSAPLFRDHRNTYTVILIRAEQCTDIFHNFHICDIHLMSLLRLNIFFLFS